MLESLVLYSFKKSLNNQTPEKIEVFFDTLLEEGERPDDLLRPFLDQYNIIPQIIHHIRIP